MAYILHIDTSADTGLVALGHQGKTLDRRVNTETRNHASVINLDIEAVLKEAGIEMKQLDAISVCGGPGSYTGLRIGLATAKGICYVQDIPLLMPNRLTLMALEGKRQSGGAADILAVLKAREGEYFVAAYDSEMNEIFAPAHLSSEQLQEKMDDLKAGIICSADDEFLESLTESNILKITTPVVESWLPYSYQQYNSHAFVNLANAEPYYLKNVFIHKSKKSN